MNYNFLFAWNNYDESPLKGIENETVVRQKNATYSEPADGVFTGDVNDTFFTNNDKISIPGIATPIGMEPGVVTEGHGVVLLENE